MSGGRFESRIGRFKKLTAAKREKLYARLLEEQAAGRLLIGIGEASCREIDELNILQATFLAMRRAVERLPVCPRAALVDGNRTPKPFPCACKTVVKGDSRSFSIAAASVVAKVYRDRLMKELAQKYPGYGFEKNAGYGTAAHIEGLKNRELRRNTAAATGPSANFCKIMKIRG